MSAVESVINSNRNDQPDRLKLYYFPDITVEMSSDSDFACAPDAGFQKSDFCGAPDTGLDAAGQNIESLHDIKDKLYHQGFQDGQRVGAKEIEDRYGSIMNQVQAAVNELVAKEQDAAGQIEHEIIALAMGVARKIIKQELQLDRNVVLSCVREALAQTAEREQLKLLVNPADLPVMESALMHFTDILEEPGKVALAADARISCGGCIVETRSCSVDARIEKQLEHIEASLKKAFST